MSENSNLAWWLLAFGAGTLVLGGGAGYAAGRKLHGPTADVRIFRDAANRVFADIRKFYRVAKLREKEIAPSSKRFRKHGELPLTAADKAYFRTGTEDARTQLTNLNKGLISLTTRQQETLARLWLEDITQIAPIVARQSGIAKVQHQLGKRHPDKLLPDQIHVGPQHAAPASHQPKKAGADDVARWKELRKELQQKHNSDKAKWVGEIKNHPLTLAVKQSAPGYWQSQVQNVPELA